MRLFTGIDIPRDVANALEARLSPLRALAKLSWSPIEKLHITTKFIGEWPEERLDELKKTLATISADRVALSIRRIGWMPSPRHPRLLYAGVEPAESLLALAKATEQALERIGIAREDRIYRPHLTLARVRDRVPLGELKSALSQIEFSEFGAYEASSFFLYLSAEGKYTKLQEFPLDT